MMAALNAQEATMQILKLFSIDGRDRASKVPLIRFTRASLTGFSIRRSILAKSVQACYSELNVVG